MKVEVAVLGSPSLIVLMVSLCGRKATLNLNLKLASKSLLLCLSICLSLSLSVCLSLFVCLFVSLSVSLSLSLSHFEYTLNNITSCRFSRSELVTVKK